MNREIELLLTEIESQFQSTPPMAPQMAKDSEGWEETQDFWGKTWSELHADLFQKRMDCFAFLGYANFGYFFGALMFNSLIEGRLSNNALDMLLALWHGEDLSSVLDDGHNPIGVPEAVARELRAILSEKQKETIERFFAFRRNQIETHDDDLVERFLASISNAKIAKR